MTRRSMITVVAAAALLFACGGDDDAAPVTEPPGAETDETAIETAAPAPGEDGAAASIATADTDLGVVLVDEDGMTLYLFDPDEQGPSTCFDECAQTWPPVAGPLAAGAGVDAGSLGTVDRDDGTTQATYDGWPLYLFAGDRAPGDIAGQGVQDVWWALTPDGTRAATGDGAGGDSDGGSNDGSGQEGVGY